MTKMMILNNRNSKKMNRAVPKTNKGSTRSSHRMSPAAPPTNKSKKNIGKSHCHAAH